MNPSAKLQEKRICLFFRENIAHLTHGLALGPWIVASAEKYKSVFVHAKYILTHCYPTIHVLKKFTNAFVIPTIRGESATHHKCSQFFHNSLQRNIGSCRGGEFGDG